MASKYGTKEIKGDFKKGKDIKHITEILSMRHDGTTPAQWLLLVNKIVAGQKPTPEDWAIEPAPAEAPKEEVKTEPVKSAPAAKRATTPYGEAEIVRDLKLGYSRNQIVYKLQVRNKTAKIEDLLARVDKTKAEYEIGRAAKK